MRHLYPILILVTLTSCAAKTVTQLVEVHDTLQDHHTDTLKEVKVTHHTDTVKQIEKHTYTINNVGDTIKEIHHYHDVQHTIVIDSTNRYQSKIDSLQSIIDRNHEKEATIVKKPSLWWSLKVFGICFLVALGLLVLLWKTALPKELR